MKMISTARAHLKSATGLKRPTNLTAKTIINHLFYINLFYTHLASNRLAWVYIIFYKHGLFCKYNYICKDEVYL